MRIERITALAVKDGDLVMFHGVLCRVSNVRHHDESATVLHPACDGPVARYNLTSEPSPERPGRLPGNFDGATYGGNYLCQVSRVVPDSK